MREPILRSFQYLSLLLLPGIALANVVENIENQTYPVRGDASKNLKELVSSASPIRQNGKIFHGNTKWVVNWSYKMKSDRNGVCTVTQATTQLSGRILLPTLIESNATQKSQFESYLNNLRTHEMGHYAIARRGAEAVDAMILSLPSMSNCSMLKADINDRANLVVEKFRKMEIQYDLDTGHGVTQGAKL